MTIALNENWDIYGDPSGNLAITDDDHGVLQDVATAVQMWCADGDYDGDNIYDVEQGLPYKSQILGKADVYGMALLMDEIANVVPGVKKAVCRPDNPLRGRLVTGKIIVQLLNGRVGFVGI